MKLVFNKTNKRNWIQTWLGSQKLEEKGHEVCFQEMKKKGWRRCGSKYEVRSQDDENSDTIRYDSKHEMGFQESEEKILKVMFQTWSELPRGCY